MEQKNYAILCPKKSDALELNNEIVIIRVAGRLWSLLSVDSLIVDNDQESEQANLFPIEAVHDLLPAGLPAHVLNVKIGCVVMLLINIDTSRGLCNDARLIVRNISQNILDVEILNEPHRGTRCLLNKFST